MWKGLVLSSSTLIFRTELLEDFAQESPAFFSTDCPAGAHGFSAAAYATPSYTSEQQAPLQPTLDLLSAMFIECSSNTLVTKVASLRSRASNPTDDLGKNSTFTNFLARLVSQVPKGRAVRDDGVLLLEESLAENPNSKSIHVRAFQGLRLVFTGYRTTVRAKS